MESLAESHMACRRWDKNWKGRCAGVLGRGCAVIFQGPLRTRPPSFCTASPCPGGWPADIVTGPAPSCLLVWTNGEFRKVRRELEEARVFIPKLILGQRRNYLFLSSGNDFLSLPSRLRGDNIFYLNSPGHSPFLVSLHP